MTTVLRIRDEATNAVILEVTDQADSDLLTQHMGAVSIAAGTNGSVAVPVLGSANQLYYWFVADTTEGRSRYPSLYDDGNTINWQGAFTPGANYSGAVGGTLYYGRC